MALIIVRITVDIKYGIDLIETLPYKLCTSTP